MARLIQVPFGTIRRAYLKGHSHGLALNWDLLIAHHLAGGNVTSLVDGQIFARENGIELSDSAAGAHDLYAKHKFRVSLADYLKAHLAEGIRDFRQSPFLTDKSYRAEINAELEALRQRKWRP